MQMTCWTYTREEWRRFRKWRAREKGFLFAFFRKLVPGGHQKTPEVRITDDRVWVNNRLEPFHDLQRQFREIQIREADSLHILEIRYEQGSHIRGIRVPIPRGKLREAFAIQQRLESEMQSAGH